MLTSDEAVLLRVALGLGARGVAGWSPAEDALCADLAPEARVASTRSDIRAGRDPLGDAFCAARSASKRRPLGATYTPDALVAAMVQWAPTPPDRVVDPGVGSARFLVASGRVFPNALLHGVECDPLAAVLARGHLAAAGLAERATVQLGDYRSVTLPATNGHTLFLGNPPYVRHHGIAPEWKAWLTRTATALSLPSSQLAGLHVHFYLATARHARAGDLGCFVTAAEWLDVAYGRLLRGLFLEVLGGDSLTVIEPEARPFPDAQATAAIATFRVGSRSPTVRVRRVADLTQLHPLGAGVEVPREALARATRWSPLTRGPRPEPEGTVELGALCRVHRGQVTGRNQTWIAGSHSRGLPDSVLFPCVTRAAELFAAGGVLAESTALRRVIDLPEDLDALDSAERAAVEDFLAAARRLGADTGYVARARRAWWRVGLRASAPILATYMARRPPAFVRNLVGARHINVAHGLYPREALAPEVLDGLAAWLARGVMLADGRTYAGGLTKFEPGEMERLRVPAPERLAAFAVAARG